jgi:BirA family biotin operon repressor/biotin-[acetyl-CoA-carboxylase] ligase
MGIDAEAYERRVREVCAGRANVFFRKETGSTNDDARAMLLRGEIPPFAAVAVAQTASRGRRGTPWISDVAGNLCLSYALPAAGCAPGNIARLGQWVAVEICGMLGRKFSVGARVKWPNDIFVGTKKMGGLLPEAIVRGGAAVAVVLGVGINISHAPQLVGTPYGAACVRDVSPGGCDFVEVAGEIIGAVVAAVDDFPSVTAESFCEKWKAFDSTFGAPIIVRAGGEEIRGIDLGIGPAGELIVGGMAGGAVRTFPGGARMSPAVDAAAGFEVRAD